MKRNETLALFEEETKALSVIRTETALSRFPMHRLSRGKEIQIELKNQGGAIHWNVSHNSKYGQPGPLAYKIDTLIINRRIDRTGRPVPTMLRLGSLREIAEEVGSGTNTTTVKQALLQNATASIAAKIHYKTHDAGEKSLEAVFTRYQVIFTGETLPNGSSADAVYLVFNSIYHDILNNAIYRPLDYDYMKALTPAAQKFYEIVSYQIYAALHHHNARARLLYSEYCLLSTAARYYDFDHVKKQMYKVHRPHIDSGYIAKVTYEATTNEAGEADWWMCYTPGRNAGREYHAFTGSSKARRSKKTPKAGLTLPLAETEKAPGQPQASGTNSQGSQPTTPASTPEQRPSKPVRARKAVPTTEGIPMEAQPGVVSSGETARPVAPPPVQNDLPGEDATRPSDDTTTNELVELLVAAELNRGDAERFARERAAVCQRQLAYLPYIQEFKTSRGAYLRRAIEEDYGPPAAYSKARAKEETAASARQRKAEAAFVIAQEKARQSHHSRFKGAYNEFLCQMAGELEKTQPEAFTAFLRVEAEERERLMKSPLADRPLFQEAITNFDAVERRADRLIKFCNEQGRQYNLSLLDFWQWDERHNPQRFSD